MTVGIRIMVCGGLVAAGFWTSLGSSAAAQTAQISLVHNDPDGVVMPGETIRVTALHTRDNGPLEFTFLSYAAGDVAVSPNIGSTGGLSSAFTPAVTTMWSFSPGSPAGAGLTGVGVNLPNHPSFFAWFPAVWVVPSVELLSFDWTAPSVPSPHEVTFGWMPSAAQPQVKIFNISQMAPYAIPTTSTPTSILVLPAPGVAVVLGAAGLVVSARRRASARPGRSS